MQSFLCTSARARRHSWSRPPCSRRPPASYPRCYAPYPNSLQPLPPKSSPLMTPHFFQKNLLTTGGESTPKPDAPSITRLRTLNYATYDFDKEPQRYICIGGIESNTALSLRSLA